MTTTFPSDTALPQPPLLAVRGLDVAFPRGAGWLHAVRGVSFDIHRGETLGLVGESGSGKSLTAFGVIGLVPAPGRTTGGAVLLDGRDLVGLSELEWCGVRGRRIGFVFQEPMTALDPVHTVGTQIAEVLAVHGLARGREAHERAVVLLDDVAMPEPSLAARAYPHQLSGGMRQRAMIAIALAGDPDLLIADEPTTALDVTVQAQILDLLRLLKARRRLALLLITHDLGVVAQMADRVAVMYGGRVVETSGVRELFATPRHPYTRGLLESVPGGSAGARLVAIDGVVPALDAMPAGCAFTPRCGERLARCGDDPPPAFDVGAAHQSRCWLHDAARVDRGLRP